MTVYLSSADTLAIGSGTWTIDPAQSLGMPLGGTLPIEELVFFMLTTILVTLGLILGIAEESWVRVRAMGLLRHRDPVEKSKPPRANAARL
jgi:hypothetical protein